MPYDDTPRLGADNPELRDELNIRERRTLPDVSGDDRLYRRLTDTVAAMTASGPNADEVYQEALRQQQDDEEFANLVLKTLDTLEESAYIERWALIQLAIDLKHPVVAEYLADFVRRPIPEEQSEDPGHGLSTVTEEVILRTTAIEGLARLLARDVDTTETLMETIANADYVAMRRAAWFALVENGGDDAVERARSILDERGDGWIAQLRRIPVQEATQHDTRLIDPNGRSRDRMPAPYDE